MPYRRSDPRKLAADKNAIIQDLESRTETDTYAPVSPAEKGIRARRPRGRRITNLGIVTGTRVRNSPV